MSHKKRELGRTWKFDILLSSFGSCTSFPTYFSNHRTTLSRKENGLTGFQCSLAMNNGYNFNQPHDIHQIRYQTGLHLWHGHGQLPCPFMEPVNLLVCMQLVINTNKMKSCFWHLKHILISWAHSLLSLVPFPFFIAVSHLVQISAKPIGNQPDVFQNNKPQYSFNNTLQDKHKHHLP